MSGAAMPKTAVNEYCKSLAPKDEIGLSRKWLLSPPAGNSVGSHYFP
jgi:hypothetical protein